MAGSFSDYLENEVLDHILKTGSWSAPTNIYVGLSTADPLDSSTGVAEPSGNNYARVVCNTWDAAASGATANTSAISFPEASGSWGTITHFFLADSLTSTGSNNFLCHADLDTSKAIVSGDALQFDAGDLDITLT